MKKNLAYTILLAMLSFFGGCGAEKLQENSDATNAVIEFQNPDEQVEKVPVNQEETDAGTVIGDSNIGETDPLLENRKLLEEKIATLEAVDWTELTCYADEETSLLNSNLLLNFGHLTYDEKGQIYFTDMNDGGIYVSDWNGENKRQISEDSAGGLQVAGEWLYYNCYEGIMKRIQCETGDVEVIREKPCGEYIVFGGKLYTNGPEGFCVAEPDGTNKTILREQDLVMIPQQVAGSNFWIGNASNGTDGQWFMKGYLLGYDEIQDEWCFVKQGAGYPLLAGNWLSVFDAATSTRHVWDLEKDKEIDLGIYDQRSVSDGTTLYCNSNHLSCSIFYQWNGKETEELFRVEGENMYVEYKYLTPKTLYWLQSVVVEGTQVWELWYYDLKTEEIGKIY
ncbi:MAG: DUF5050 domain-containing protein [Lachnospiraceae bacterium]